MIRSLQAFGRDLSAPFYQRWLRWLRWLHGVTAVIGCLRTLKTSETAGDDIRRDSTQSAQDLSQSCCLKIIKRRRDFLVRDFYLDQACQHRRNHGPKNTWRGTRLLMLHREESTCSTSIILSAAMTYARLGNVSDIMAVRPRCYRRKSQCLRNYPSITSEHLPCRAVT